MIHLTPPLEPTSAVEEQQTISPRHKHLPAGPAHLSDRRTSSGQYIVSVTGPYGPPRYMSGHQISNSAGPNDDNSQYMYFSRGRPSHISAVFAQPFCYSETPACRESESGMSIKHTDVSV